MNLKTAIITLAITMMVSLSGYAQNGPGAGAGGTLPPPGTQPTPDQAADLIWVREEEKLARDTYVSLYEKWGARIFSNISRAEQQHMDSMLQLLQNYNLVDPVKDDTTGVFSDPVLADLYKQLVANGDDSLADALHVGAFIEELDIHDIEEALEGITQADIKQVYESLLAGSYNHLRAFVGQIESLGIVYVPQYLDQSEVDAIVGSSEMTAQMSDGSWAVTGHDGEGMVIDVTTEGKLLMYWMTYDNQGKQVWLLGLTDQTSEAIVHMNMYRYSGPAFGAAFSTEDLKSELWGEVMINFLDCGNAEVNYQSVSGFGSGNLQIQRIYYAAGSICQP